MTKFDRFEIVDLKILANMPCVNCITQGHWTRAVAEIFTSDPTEVDCQFVGEPTHVHFYLSQDEARELLPEISHLIPDGVKTCTFSHYPCGKCGKMCHWTSYDLDTSICERCLDS